MSSHPEKSGWRVNGFIMLLILLVLLGFGFKSFIDLRPIQGLWFIIPAVLLMPGFFMVQPNQARVLTFLGSYSGTIRQVGFSWTNPFALKRAISLRMRNFNSERLKVNDAAGNPIEIAAVIVWKVIDRKSVV